MDTHYLLEIAEIFLVAALSGLILSRFKIPPVVGYILTGVILGPGALGLITNEETIKNLAEIGVIALLFTLGLEFSIDKFKQVGKKVLIAGISQISITLALVAFIAKMYGLSTHQAVFFGCVVALSSTVIVVKSLTDNAQLESIHGKIMLGILIIQDLSLIPIMIILPQLSGTGAEVIGPLVFAIVKALFFLGTAILLSIKIAPIVMNQVASAGKEILILTSISIAIGTAIAASFFGISLAIGAFIAGLALSITAHSKQVIAEVVPFRDVFAMVFFVSIGILMDIQFFQENIWLVLAVVSAILVIKFLVVFAVVCFIRYPGQTALWSALGLFQIGEFSFVLAQVGFKQNIITADMYSLIIISTLLTMLATPFVLKGVPDLILRLQNVNFWNKHFMGKFKVSTAGSTLDEHVIICGYGPIGSSVAKILKIHCDKFVVVELNNTTVKKLKKQNTPVIYGDATHKNILKHAGIGEAKIIVISLPDAKSCEMAVLNARAMNKDIYIIVRSRYQQDIDKLYQAGANVVIYEEYETSLAIVDNVLSKLGYPCHEIETVSGLIRANKCQLLQESYKAQDYSSGRMGIFLNNEVEWIKIPKESCIIGTTLGESSIRQKTGTSIISLLKGGNNIPNPPASTLIEGGDILVALGTPEQLSKLRDVIIC